MWTPETDKESKEAEKISIVAEKTDRQSNQIEIS